VVLWVFLVHLAFVGLSEKIKDNVLVELNFSKRTFGNSILSLGRSIITGFRVRSNSLAKLKIIITPTKKKAEDLFYKIFKQIKHTFNSTR
jgi:hypothetical protein